MADLWRLAEPEVEDVNDGICISILLPNIKKLVRERWRGEKGYGYGYVYD
jgi:hypothetical protein